MKIALSWLESYVDLDRPISEVAHILTMAGIEVAEIREVGADWNNVYVGRITSLEKHPNADRLLLATVDYGADPITVVTGAPGLEIGDVVPLALAGATLHDPYSESPRTMKVKPAKLRGVRSEGMVCSAKELGLGEDHSGIMKLDHDCEIGRDLREEFGETIIQLDVTPNRSDCLSVLGVASEIAAHLDTTVRRPSIEWQGAGEPSDDLVSIEIADTDLCSRYCGTVVRGLKVGPSPRWLRQRLEAVGLRPINNVVDVTNYVMWEFGQPLHAFDFRTLRGAKIIVRRARPGESIVTIDRVDRELDNDTLVIADAERPVALAGVMGGGDTEVNDATVDVLIESATFGRTSIRKTVQKHKLPSEASRRFDKGLPLELSRIAVDRATRLMLQVAGGQAAPGVVDACPELPSQETIVFPISEAQRLLGVDLTSEAVQDVMRRLSIGVEIEDSCLVLRPPYWRTDLRIKADIVEELARIIGYDQLPTRMPSGEVPEPRPARSWQQAERIRSLLAGLRLSEIVTYPLVSEERQGRIPRAIGGSQTGSEFDERFNPPVTPIKLVNPLSADSDALRVNMIAQLLETLRDNLRYREGNVDLFEIGKIYLRNDDALPEERNLLAAVLYRDRTGRRWGEVDTQDFYDGKALVKAVADSFGLVLDYRRLEHPLFLTGRAAGVIGVGAGSLVGAVGEIQPDVLSEFDIEKSTIVVVFDLDRLGELPAEERRYEPLPRFPAVQQDLAIVVDQSITSAEVEQVILHAGQPLLESIELFDLFQGESIGWGRRSLAYHLNYRVADRTLTDEEVASRHQAIIKALSDRLGATLRA